VTTLSFDILDLTILLSVFLAGGTVLFFLWRRAVANEECFNCRRSMGTRFEHELVRSEPPNNVYRKFRVCRSCGARSLMKEYSRRQQ
jgi:hypothetical protein